MLLPALIGPIFTICSPAWAENRNGYVVVIQLERNRTTLPGFDRIVPTDLQTYAALPDCVTVRDNQIGRCHIRIAWPRSLCKLSY